MLNLASTSDLIRVVTESAGGIEVHATWVDLLTTTGVVTPGRTNTADITTATTTTVVGSPAASTVRNVKQIWVRNSHATVSNIIAITHTDGSTEQTIWKGTLAPNELVGYVDGAGWQVLNSFGRPSYTQIAAVGNTKEIQYNNSGAFAGSSSLTWDESTKKLTIKGSIEAYNDGGTQADIYATSYGVDGGGTLHGRMANGTFSSPTGILSGDIFGGVGSRAYHSGGAFQTSSPTSIHWVASENQTGSAYGSYLRILTTPKGSTTRQERVIVSDSGTLWVHDTGTFDPKTAAQTKPVSDVLLLASGTGNTAVGVFSYGTGLTAGFRGGSCAGTPASPSATTSETIISFMGGHVHDGTNWTAGTKALLTFKSAQAITGSNQGTYITLETTPLNSTTRAEGVRIDPDGNLLVQQAGKGLRVKEGSNAKQGTATLSAGSVTVSNTSVTANSRIFLTSQSDGGTPGFLRVSARSAGTNFTITSSSGSDTSTVAYQIFEPA
jgi:hypothetical protein